MFKLRNYDGAVIRITEATPTVEYRYEFNSSIRRIVEPCRSGVSPNAIAFTREPMDLREFDDYTRILIGNLKPGVVESILSDLVNKGYADLSELTYQKEQDNVCNYVFDNGESDAYYANIYNIYFNSCMESLEFQRKQKAELDIEKYVLDFSDEELRKVLYDLGDYTMFELGKMTREELEAEYDSIEVGNE